VVRVQDVASAELDGGIDSRQFIANLSIERTVGVDDTRTE